MIGGTNIGYCQQLWHELSRPVAQALVRSFDISTCLVSYFGILQFFCSSCCCFFFSFLATAAESVGQCKTRPRICSLNPRIDVAVTERRIIDTPRLQRHSNLLPTFSY